VWLPSGARIELGKQPLLLRILEHLADSGGAATKESLVLSVWEERDYHPLRHDNRLQAAVRKLRQRIEDDPANPRRLVTTEDGYALGSTPRIAG
jgi:DNA-binding response OmpR family regulator